MKTKNEQLSIAKVSKFRDEFYLTSILLAKLRQYVIKGNKHSYANNPIANLFLYEFLEQVKDVWADEDHIEMRLHPFVSGGVNQINVNTSSVLRAFLVAFNDGKYPEFEE